MVVAMSRRKTDRKIIQKGAVLLCLLLEFDCVKPGTLCSVNVCIIW